MPKLHLVSHIYYYTVYTCEFFFLVCVSAHAYFFFLPHILPPYPPWLLTMVMESISHSLLADADRSKSSRSKRTWTEENWIAKKKHSK